MSLQGGDGVAIQWIASEFAKAGLKPANGDTTDTAEKINNVKMAKILRLAYLSGYAFADEATPPKFIESPGAAASKAGN